MELIRCGLNSKVNLLDPLVITIGEFDGVHYAHSLLIKKVVEKAKEKKFKSAVMTFSPHPAYVLGKRQENGYITTLEQKKDIIEKLGVDYLIVVEFTIELSKLSYQDFEKEIIDMFNVQSIICGFDFKYGHKGYGNYETLKEKYDTIYFDKIVMDENKVSSTLIRKNLEEGNVEEANKLLKRPFSLRGKVIKGNNVGSKIGLATANLFFDDEFYFLKPGVYSTYVNIDGLKYIGVCNIGHNPTFNYVHNLSVEVHILDFDKSIYNEMIEIEFMHFIREEVKFNSVDELLNRIDKDIKITKELL